MLTLHAKPDAELRGELWRIAEIGNSYQLWYNKDVPSFAARLKSKLPDILGSILPSAIRQILSREHLWGEVNSEPSEWTRFGESISGEPLPVGQENEQPTMMDIEEWIDNVVAAFCRNRARFVERIAAMEEAHEPSPAQ
jgi:hypothetical protein